jgi:chromosome segregation ATPase
MTNETETARENLRAIQHAGRDRWKEIGELHNAIDLATAAVEKLECELARFGDLDAIAARDRIERLKAAAKSGIAPTGEVGAEIIAMAAEKAEVEKRLAAAREAMSLLQRELAVEEDKARRYDREVELAAEQVVVAEFEKEAEALNREIYELRARKEELNVIVNSLVVHEKTMLRGHAAPYPVARRFNWRGHVGDAFNTDIGANRYLPVEAWTPITSKWNQYFDALQLDADASMPAFGQSTKAA